MKQTYTRRFVSLFMAFCMLVSLVSLPSAARAAGQSAPHWAQETMEKWGELGWLKGYGTGDYLPDTPITRAEFFALINRFKGYTEKSDTVAQFTDVAPGSWYYGEVAAALAAGYAGGTGAQSMSPNEPINRQESFAIVARMEGLDIDGADTKLLRRASDGALVAGWAEKPLAAALAAGFLAGTDGRIAPLEHLTRAQAVTLLDRVYTDARTYAFAGTYGPSDGLQTVGSVTLVTPGITLQNITTSGDLTVAESVGDGEVTLENVTVTGALHVNGGGENSIYFDNCNIKELIVTKTGVRVVMENGTVVTFARALTGDSVFELTGNTKVETLTIIGEGVTIKAGEGTSIGTLNADANNTSVETSPGSTIGTANLNGETEITGQGTIAEANIAADNCVLERRPNTVNVEGNRTAEIAGSNVNNAPPSGGGGYTPPTPVYDRHNIPSKTAVPYNTPFGELDLPATAVLTATTGATVTVNVAWVEADYDQTTPGMQTVRGDVSVLSDPIPSWAPAQITVPVTVLDAPIATTLVIKGATTQSEPISVIAKGGSAQFTTLIHDQFDIIMTGQSVTWEISPAVTGVSVSDGLVTVAPTCAADSFTLKAQCGGASDTITVEVQTPIGEQAPQVINLDILSFNRNQDGKGNDLYIRWTTPASLPYPVKYLLEIVDELDNVRGTMQSATQDPNDSLCLNYTWNWELLSRLPHADGTYRIRVTTVALHNNTLNSEPVYCARTIEISSAIPAPEFSHMEFLGMKGTDMNFRLVLPAEAVPLEAEEHYLIIFNYGTGWMDIFCRQPQSELLGYDLELCFTADPARGGGNVDPENCLADVFSFTPIVFDDDTVSVMLSPTVRLFVASPAPALGE